MQMRPRVAVCRVGDDGGIDMNVRMDVIGVVLLTCRINFPQWLLAATTMCTSRRFRETGFELDSTLLPFFEVIVSRVRHFGSRTMRLIIRGLLIWLLLGMTSVSNKRDLRSGDLGDRTLNVFCSLLLGDRLHRIASLSIILETLFTGFGILVQLGIKDMGVGNERMFLVTLHHGEPGQNVEMGEVRSLLQ